MKLNIRNIAVCCLTLASIFACQRVDLDSSEQTGYLYVDIDRDESEDLVFKSAAQAADPVMSLTVYDSKDSVVAQYADWKELQGKPVQLKVGKYKAVSSSAAKAADAAFDAPFYRGEKDFIVTADAVSNIEIVCTLANVKVTANFSEEIKKNFKKYELVVSNGNADLTFSNLLGTEANEGYFGVTGTLTWTLNLTDNNDRQYKALTETYTEVKPKQHFNLSFSVEEKPQVGSGGITIVVDNSLVEKKYDLTLNFGETNPPLIKPDFEYVSGQQLEVNAGDLTSKKFALSSVNGFKNIIFNYDGIRVDLVGAQPETISTLASAGIKTASVTEGEKSASIDITEYISRQPIGSCDVSILATDIHGVYSETSVKFMLRSPVSSQAVSADAWAMFATLSGKWFTEIKPEGIELHYKKVADLEWTVLQESSLKVDDAKKVFSAEIRGLVPGTEYEFKTTTASDKQSGKEGPVVKFTTEGTPVLPNMSFDNWTMGSTGWFPNATSDESSPEFIWDSANTKVSIVQIEVTTPEESNVAVSGAGKKAAKLSSIVKAGKFAAGNIYTGNFGQATMSPMGATLKWGVPFSGRPLALKGHYNYIPVSINKTDSAHGHLNGHMDVGQIQIMLTTWSAPFDIDTAKGKFVDVNAPEVIAYATMDLNATSGYQEFELKLEYRDTTRKPTYIVIVGAASKYGDFFTGGEGTVLYLDEFEFVYDKDKLSK